MIDSQSVATSKVYHILHIYIVYDIHLNLFTYYRLTECITWSILAYVRASFTYNIVHQYRIRMRIDHYAYRSLDLGHK